MCPTICVNSCKHSRPVQPQSMFWHVVVAAQISAAVAMLAQAGDAELLLLREQLAVERERSQPSAERVDTRRNVLRKISWSTSPCVETHATCKEEKPSKTPRPTPSNGPEMVVYFARICREIGCCWNSAQFRSICLGVDMLVGRLQRTTAARRLRRSFCRTRPASERTVKPPNPQHPSKCQVKQQGMELDRPDALHSYRGTRHWPAFCHLQASCRSSIVPAADTHRAATSPGNEG